jgi:hypothetical protein
MMPIVLKQRQTEGQRTRQLGRYGRLLDKLFHILTSLLAVFVLGIVVAVTFAVASQFLVGLHLHPEEFTSAFLAIMEPIGIVAAIFLARWGAAD